ncbi:CENPU protein, partial [Thinocorus orbignyianus]|nr:CENPU protein [Thinocorus orbignyianus]
EEPDVSRILKVAEVNQLEEPDDSFDHPLHSTAVDAYGEEQLQHEPLGRVSAPRRKNAERRSAKKKQRPSDATSRNTSEKTSGNTSESTSGKTSESTSGKTSENTSEKTSENASESISYSIEVWCPKELKRSSADITELDVVLTEFEKVAAHYRQRIDSNVCRKAVNSFCSAFKNQITDLIAEIQELKNTKKKNAKVISDIKKKRQRLLELKEELIEAEPRLSQLQREYAEVQEKKSSLRQATELLSDLKELQQDCLNYREENPKEKLVYEASSLPALLVESRRILRAERHFQNINMKLEKALAAERENLPEKH